MFLSKLKLKPAENMIGGRMIAKKISFEKEMVVLSALISDQRTYLQKTAVRIPMIMTTVD